MTQPTDNNVTTWRDLADQLTPSQLTIFEAASLRPETTPAELLEWAHEAVLANAEQAKVDARLAHIELPAGATTGGWDSINPDTGDASRSLEWWRRDADKAVVTIEGLQDETGAFDRHIMVFAQRGDLDDLTADDARSLAALLTEATDELDRLNAR